MLLLPQSGLALVTGLVAMKAGTQFALVPCELSARSFGRPPRSTQFCWALNLQPPSSLPILRTADLRRRLIPSLPAEVRKRAFQYPGRASSSSIYFHSAHPGRRLRLLHPLALCNRSTFELRNGLPSFVVAESRLVVDSTVVALSLRRRACHLHVLLNSVRAWVRPVRV